ncbi:MAG: hypothetical protein ABSE82_15650, partial [Nitrososphaerales archaeon]
FSVNSGSREVTLVASKELSLIPNPVASEARLTAAIRIQNITTRSGFGPIQALPIQGNVPLQSLPATTVLHSVWITALVGGTTWINPKFETSELLPVLSAEGRSFRASQETYIRPRWALLTYDVHVRHMITGSELKFTLRGSSNFVVQLSKNSQWANVGIHRMTLPVVENHEDSLIQISAAPAPFMSTMYEVGTATGLPIREVLTLRFPPRYPQDPIITGATLDLSLAIPAGAHMGPTAFNAIGAIDIAMIGLGTWSAAAALMGSETLSSRLTTLRRRRITEKRTLED